MVKKRSSAGKSSHLGSLIQIPETRLGIALMMVTFIYSIKLMIKLYYLSFSFRSELLKFGCVIVVDYILLLLLMFY